MSRIYRGSKYRITVLTDRLFRFEYSEAGHFVDEKTSMAVCRDFDDCIIEKLPAEDGGLKLKTVRLLPGKDGGPAVRKDALMLSYDGRAFSSTGLQVKDLETGEVWTCSNSYASTEGNLQGTARTLDRTDGVIPMEEGIFSRAGYAKIDDSLSPIIDDSGEMVERTEPETDLYLFFYGKDFAGGLSAFYHLTGKTPMLPRYALGNWWSKYEKYTEESYNALMDQFEAHKIPLSVAVIDMDWHLTEIDHKYGTGWTGFTWNPEYFPDYKRFLKGLHDRGLAVTLNLHPADGIRGYEAMYPQVAEELGLDAGKEEAADFDLSDPHFRKAYFDLVLQPYEKGGVDFWWIDWQQGTRMGKTNVDPLWLLNHYSFEAAGKDRKRPMIFSRYAGPGSHRYPIGFSGDSYATWRSLDVQPWFTSTASNIGYGWWSHDIGGHMFGDRDDERLTRWVELGVFSPIMRLHSSSSPFFVKEPWKVEQPYGDIISRYLRLRQRLVPYLYTMNYRAWHDDMPLVRPVYYRCPEDERAYDVPNEYFFGDSLLAGAITKPIDRTLRLAPVSMLIPEGRWIDVFTGHWYQGGRNGIRRKLYRKMDKIPVLMKEGSLLPLLWAEDAEGSQKKKDTGDVSGNPVRLMLLAAAGADGFFTLYEDDNETVDYLQGKCARTEFSMSWNDGQAKISILPADGDLSLVPETRSYKVCIIGAKPASEQKVAVSGADAETEVTEKGVKITLPSVKTAEGVTFTVSGLVLTENDWKTECLTLLAASWGATEEKDRLLSVIEDCDSPEAFGRYVREADLDEKLKDALIELL